MKIFLAHAKEDKKTVTDLYHRLKERGYEPWLDKEDLLPGQIWRAEIPRAIKNSQVFIACLSKRSVEKQGYVQDEFKIALKACASKPAGSIYLIPVRLDECIIPELRQEEYGTNLRDIHWLDFFESDGFDKLVRALEYAKSIEPAKNESNAPINDSFFSSQPPILPPDLQKSSDEQRFGRASQFETVISEVGSSASVGTSTLLNYISQNRTVALAILFLLGIAIVITLSLALQKPNPPVPNDSTVGGVQNKSSTVYSQNPAIQKRFSSGERLLLSKHICREGNYEEDCRNSLDSAEEGSKAFRDAAFKNGGYSQAIDHFNRAIVQYSNNPELYIYRNNAIVRQAMAEGSNKRKVTLAAAVPADSDASPSDTSPADRDTIGGAEEMLRGIADAQSCYIGQQGEDQPEDLKNNPLNCDPDLENVLLEVVVVDDDNLPEVAKENAQAIMADNVDISGVIGHYASGVTKAALETYADSGSAIPVISPTSSESELKKTDGFYRTTTSNKKVAGKITSYLRSENVGAVFGLYDGEDDYSGSLWTDFQEAFKGAFGEEVAGQTVISSSNVANIVNEFRKEINSKLDGEISGAQRFAVVVIPPSTFDNGTISSEQKWELVVKVSEVVSERADNGQNGFLIGGDDLYGPEALKIDRKLYGVLLTVPWFSGYYEGDSEGYAKNARKKWGGRVSWVTASSYDAAHVFMQAFAGISSETSEIRRELIARIPNVKLKNGYSSGEGIEFKDKEPTRNPFILEVLNKESDEDPSQYALKVVDGPQ